MTIKQRKVSHRERKLNTLDQDQGQLQDHHQGQPQGHHQGHCLDLIKEGPEQSVGNQEWTNISIVCHQSQDHLQGQIPDILIKRKSRPDVLNQRSISINVIHRLVQNHSQDLVQGQGHAEQRQGQRKQKEDLTVNHHIQTLIQTLRWIDVQGMEIPENIQKLCVLMGRQIGYLLKRNLTVTEKL